MSIGWLAQISASFGLKMYLKKMENSENLGCHGNGEENQQFFTLILCLSFSICYKWTKLKKIYFFLFPSHIGRCLFFSDRDS